MTPTCFRCGEPGHVVKDCPNEEVLDTRPPWCGICDARTRLVTTDLEAGTVKHCPDCHPAPSRPLTQHKRCPACKDIVHSWDTAPCGMHSVPGSAA